MALRAILFNALFRQANGKTLTAQEMHELIDRADSDKLKKARNRLAEAAEPEMQPMESPDHFSRFRVPSRLVAISVGIGIFTRNEEMMWAQLRQGLWTELPDHEDTLYDAPKTCQRSRANA